MPIIPNINNQSIAILSDIEQWKEDIAEAINTKGGSASADSSFSQLAEDVLAMPTSGILANGITQTEPFSFLKYLTSDINNEITEINDSEITTITRINSFDKNTALREVVMNNLVTISGASTFYDCTSLQSVQFPNLVTISGASTFYDCTSLQSVQFPNLVTISGSNVFQGCTSLQSVQFPNLVTISGSNVFYNCTSLQSVQFPNLVTISGASTFYDCTSLQSVQFPNLVTISRGNVFYNCASLQSVQLPNLVTISGSNVFYNCASLQNIELGTLTKCIDPFGNTKTNLRNITIGQDTDVDLPFQNWTSTNIIIEGPSGIDELNANLYNNLLTKLYDHSNDGETRILQIGWLDYITPDNIAYANAKGWTITN